MTGLFNGPGDMWPCGRSDLSFVNVGLNVQVDAAPIKVPIFEVVGDLGLGGEHAGQFDASDIQFQVLLEITPRIERPLNFAESDQEVAPLGTHRGNLIHVVDREVVNLLNHAVAALVRVLVADVFQDGARNRQLGEVSVHTPEIVEVYERQRPGVRRGLDLGFDCIGQFNDRDFSH